MEIKMTSVTLKKNLPHVYEDFYRKYGEKRFDVKVEKINESTFSIKQVPYAQMVIYRNEFPSNDARILPAQADYLNKKFN
jgi:hypothetical protein